MTITTFRGDSVIIDVTVKTAGVAKNITGGTPLADVRSPTDADTAVTAAITDAANGVLRVTIPVATLDAIGTWLGQCQLVIGAESQTVWSEPLTVSQAIRTG